jgi:RNA polymerase sigma factor (sigma-70 family)
MQSKSTYSEEELVSALHHKNQAAFAYLYDNYSPAMLGVVSQFIKDETLANDVLQEVFIAAWTNFDKYSSEKGRLFTWLHTLARNTSINKLRSKEFKTTERNQTLTDFVYNDSSLSTQLGLDNIGLRKHVNSLKEDYRNVINLVYFEGFKQDEAAKALDIPLGTVKTRLRAALVELKKLFV